MTVQHEYETTFIVRPEALDDEVSRLRSRFESIITDRGGQLMVFEDWGRRRLAYPIERHEHGRYMYFNYIGSAETPAEIERIVRIEDNVIRFLTVRLTEVASYDDVFATALERQKKRINRSRRSDDSADARRRRSAGHDNIKSPSPIRYENADGSGEDMSAEFEEEAEVVEAAAAQDESTGSSEVEGSAAPEAAPEAEAAPAPEAAPDAAPEAAPAPEPEPAAEAPTEATET
ncbi:MAG: 30S ribosomal protein S6 [Deltaproteobacteria bacterium]|nr:30S ribosomal protein S6 [Deltaproteobacteria bacterium]HCH62010.1 30S ribosomal protein S6 [Deltaproteobacteria bacterium]